MRSFVMHRGNDETGVSGTGKVLEGIIFSDGTCVTRWVADTSTGRSTSIWDNLGSFLSIHVHPHPDNNTRIEFSDGSVIEHVDGELKERGPVKVRRPKAKAQ